MMDDDAWRAGHGEDETDPAGLWDFTPVPEPTDPVEQDAFTDEVIDRDLIDPDTGAGLAPMGVGVPVPEEYFERFADILPRSVLHVWRRFGFEGFGDGLFWITDPIAWAPVVREWLDPVRDRLPFTDAFYCLARSAMGNLFLWGENTGHSVEIDPTYGEVIIDQLAIQSANDPEVRQRQGRTAFSGAADRSVEGPEDVSERALPPQALERLGPVDAGQVYGFVLPPVLGGPIGVDNLRITDAHTYLTLQAQQGEITVSDPVGANWVQVAAIIGADPSVLPNQQHPEP
ncbi:GAD-like domain-containing protein [Actinomyces qiguomingii]|uniref:GAD-like domain-containing protein n=1 Tax=Actinomyces qiguomingii TaxID=2057800 RepID=UPI000CA06696|nr:GAD-like domain-containing protein [Actinomyces qiguomingii]